MALKTIGGVLLAHYFQGRLALTEDEDICDCDCELGLGCCDGREFPDTLYVKIIIDECVFELTMVMDDPPAPGSNLFESTQYSEEYEVEFYLVIDCDANGDWSVTLVMDVEVYGDVGAYGVATSCDPFFLEVYGDFPISSEKYEYCMDGSAFTNNEVTVILSEEPFDP